MYTKQPRPPYRPATEDELSALEHDTYRNSISDPAPPIAARMADFAHSEYVVVSSASRNRARYPNPADFSFRFDRKDIQQVELVSGFMPAEAVPFVYLDIEHLRHMETPNGSKVFDLVPLKETRGFTHMEPKQCAAFRPLTSFRLLDARVRLLAPETQAVLELTPEPLGTPMDSANQVTLVLKFTRNIPKPLSYA